MRMLVKDLMTPVVEVASIGDSLAAARRQLERGHIHHLPVVDGDDRLVGLLTDRNILGAWLSHGRPDREPPGSVDSEVPVEMIMERDVLTVDEETTAARAAELLEEYRSGCLPVVDAQQHVVGIITEADFVDLARKYLDRDARSIPQA